MSLLPPKVTLMSVSNSNTYMKLQNFRKQGKNAKLSKKWMLPISGQNLFPQWCPLIRDYTVFIFERLLLAFVKYALYSHCNVNCIILYFLEAKNPCFVEKNCQYLLVFAYLFCPQNSTIDSRKTSIAQESLVVESCLTSL